MTAGLDPDRPLGTQLRQHVDDRLTDTMQALEHLRDPALDGDQRRDAVHLVRKRCKEVRALLRLADGEHMARARRADRALRDASRALSAVRDAHVEATLRGDATVPVPDDDELAAVVRSMACVDRARTRVERVGFVDDRAALRRRLRSAYRRSRRAYRTALDDPTDDHLHGWRRRVKRLWYQVRLLEPSAPVTIGAVTSLLDAIGETLGEHHDIVVLVGREPGHGDVVPLPRAELRHRSQESAATALRWGAAAHVESADAFADRVVALWSLASESGTEPPLDIGASSVSDA